MFPHVSSHKELYLPRSDPNLWRQIPPLASKWQFVKTFTFACENIWLVKISTFACENIWLAVSPAVKWPPQTVICSAMKPWKRITGNTSENKIETFKEGLLSDFHIVKLSSFPFSYFQIHVLPGWKYFLCGAIKWPGDAPYGLILVEIICKEDKVAKKRENKVAKKRKIKVAKMKTRWQRKGKTRWQDEPLGNRSCRFCHF